MNAIQFDKLLEARIEKIRAVLKSKAAEYASSHDRLHNFKRAAAITGETVAQVCIGFLVKHFVSVLDIVAADAERTTCKIAMLDEKVGDLINYVILLEAILTEGGAGDAP